MRFCLNEKEIKKMKAVIYARYSDDNQREDLMMTFDHNQGENKVILVGNEETVYDVFAEYHAYRNK